MCPVYIRLREKPLMINLDFYVVTASEKCNFSFPPSPFKYPIWIGEGRSKRKSIYLYIATWMAFFCINTVSFYTHQLIILATPMGKDWCKKWKWFDECHMRGSHHWQVTKSIRNDNDILRIIADESLVISYNRPIGISISVGCGVCNLLAKQQISSKCSFHNDVNDCLCFHFHDFVFLMAPHLVNKNASNGTEGS